MNTYQLYCTEYKGNGDMLWIQYIANDDHITSLRLHKLKEKKKNSKLGKRNLEYTV